METVMVNASSAYPVHIGGGLLDRCGGLLAAVTSSRRCAVVTDSTVGPLYAGQLGRGHVWTTVTLLAVGCRLLLEKK